MTVAGLVLAAGAGTRFGGPKALARTADGEPWVARAVRTLERGGCTSVTVVLGAAADRARALVPRDAAVVVADAWADGLGASVAAGLRALGEPSGEGVSAMNRGGASEPAAEGAQATSARSAAQPPASARPTAALVTLVDLPDLPASVVRRLLRPRVDTQTLRRAVYAGAPGHPVLLGREHWSPLVASLSGDRGAARYLERQGAERVECGDLWAGADVDRPPGCGPTPPRT